MSRLQDFIIKLGHVVIEYAKNQSPELTYVEDILTKPHQVLITELNTLIDKGLKSETRYSCLNYFIYVLDQLKPLIDKTSPLNNAEALLIQDILNKFLLTVFELLDITKTTEVTLKYNNIETTAARFVSTSWLGEKVPSLMGTIVTNHLVNKISAKTKKEVKSYVKKMINEHQTLLSVPFLKEKITKLQIELKTNQDNFSLLIEKVNELEDANHVLMEEMEQISELDNRTIQSKDDIIAQLEHDLLTKENLLIQSQKDIENLTNRQHTLEETIVNLREENSQLIHSRMNFFQQPRPRENEYFPFIPYPNQGSSIE